MYIDEFGEILTEINMSRLRPTQISKNKMRVDRPTLFLTVPDTNINIYDGIKSSGFLLSTCQGIVSPNRMLTINKKKFNGKIQNLDLRKKMLNSKVGRKIKILSNLPSLDKKTKANEDKSSDYYFYDMSIYSEALKYLNSKYSEKVAARKLFKELSKVYQQTKQRMPITHIEVLLLIKDNQGLLNNVINDLRVLLPPKELEVVNFYDNYTLVSNTNNTILPIMHKERLKNKIIVQNLSKLNSLIEQKEEIEQIKKETPIKSGESENLSTLETPDKPSIFTRMVQNLQQSNLSPEITKDGTINVGVDNRELAKVLRKYKINDPDITANVKTAIDIYMEEKGGKLTKDEAELTMIKAINYSIHGKGEVDEEYLADPEKLFKKLMNRQTHKTRLNFPKKMDGYIVKPEDIVDIKHTTGAWRQKQEFESTIHTNVRQLFKSLEQVSTKPIKIKSIKHKIVESDSDRIINYKITLQNTTGGQKEPYVVELNVPASVGDRYFKIKGSTYVMATQQFLKPVTKTDKDEVRVLSNYAIVRLGWKNLKFNPTDIKGIVDYITVRYPGLIKKQDQDSCEFSDGSILNFHSNNIYTDGETNIFLDKDTGKVTNQDDEQIKTGGKNEFVYNLLFDKIQEANPEDKLTKTQKTIPYIWLYIGGIQIPFILYLWQLKGLLTSLNQLGMDYEILEKPDYGDITVQMDSGEFLAIRPKDNRERLIANGILAARFKGQFKNLDDPTEVQPIIDQTYGSKATLNMRILTQNMIDPVTRELLEFENLPTTFENLLSTYCIDVLLNKETDSLADLKIYRARLSEQILTIMYKQIKMAHNHYSEKVEFGDEKAKLELQPDYIINDLVTESGVLQHTEPTNPIEEIFLASRTIKGGKNGVPSKRAFKPEHRNIHPSHYGVMSALATPESTTVGLIVSHTMTPPIVNEYGSYGVKDENTMSGWEALSIGEALIPFQNEMDSDRMLMSATHIKQVTPTNGNEPPLVATGAEFIVPQISSSRFAIKSPKDGTVIDIDPNKTMTVKYKDGSTETFDILPRLSRTKMGGYMSLNMKTLNVGDKVKANQVIAHTKNFDKNGIFCSGKNVFMAVMQYNGSSHEDSYVITEEVSQAMTRDIVKEVQVVIPPHTRIITLEKELGKRTTNKDILVEFSYEDDLEKYLELNQLDQLDNQEVLSTFAQSQESIKLMGQNGEIVDIKIFINNKNSIDKQIVTMHNKKVKETRDLIKKLSEGATTEEGRIKAVDNMSLSFMKTGGHKLKGGVEFLGARIVYYIRQKLPMIRGDKLSGRYGNKGVIGKVIDKENTPKPEFSPRVDMFISPIGVFSRKNIAMIKELYIGKIMYFLNEQCKTMANNTKFKTETIIKLIIDVYEILADKKVVDSVKKSLEEISPNTLRKRIKEGELKLYMTIIPFTQISFEQVKTAADHLNIPLDEKVYIPELGITTKEPVPVGVTYAQALEQTSEIYSNIRSMGRYSGVTGQATKGKAREGGQSIGSLDVQALLTYDTPSFLAELLTIRSDDHRGKREVINNIIVNGKASLPERVGQGGTLNLMNTFMTAMGLNMN